MATPAEVEVVRQALAVDDRSAAESARTPWALDAERLRARYGPAAFELVAAFLTDPDLGFSAAHTLLELDPDRGLAATLAVLPRCDRNVQHVAFAEVERITWTTGTVPFPGEARLAALGVLAIPAWHADAVVEALRIAGLTGSAADQARLAPFLAPSETIPVWRDRIRHAALGSLARLRYAPASAEIRAALAAAATTGAPDLARALEVDAWVSDAGFAADASLAPELCALLAFPVPAPDGDVLPPSVAQSAARALGASVPPGPTVPRAATPADLRAWLSPDVEGWRAWCAARPPG